MASSSVVIDEFIIYYVGNIPTAFKTDIEAFLTASGGYQTSALAGSELFDYMISQGYDNIIPTRAGNRITFYKNNF